MQARSACAAFTRSHRPGMERARNGRMKARASGERPRVARSSGGASPRGRVRSRSNQVQPPYRTTVEGFGTVPCSAVSQPSSSLPTPSCLPPQPWLAQLPFPGWGPGQPAATPPAVPLAECCSICHHAATPWKPATAPTTTRRARPRHSGSTMVSGIRSDIVTLTSTLSGRHRRCLGSLKRAALRRNSRRAASPGGE